MCSDKCQVFLLFSPLKTFLHTKVLQSGNLVKHHTLFCLYIQNVAFPQLKHENRI